MQGDGAGWEESRQKSVEPVLLQAKLLTEGKYTSSLVTALGQAVGSSENYRPALGKRNDPNRAPQAVTEAEPEAL